MVTKKNLLTEDEVERIKAACETSEERSIIRDLADTSMRLDEVLENRSKFHPDLYA